MSTFNATTTPSASSTPSSAQNHLNSYLLGLLAIFCFSLTLPATKIAVREMHPFFISAGRSVFASLPALLYLYLTKQKIPTFAQFKKIACVSLGVVLGFPTLISFAMQIGKASHGGVILAILPLATTCCAFIFAQEKPSLKFWLYAIAGSLLVFFFSFAKSHGISWGDLYLLLAVALAAMAYSIGATLTKELGGLAVIAWAIIIALPILIIPTLYFMPNDLLKISAPAWASFFYMAMFSQFLGFWPWYKALSQVGVAKIGQLQLLQPFFTIFAAYFLINEALELKTFIFVALIALIVSQGRQAIVGQRR
jgi:drug/metabolite transporter (DMT)-like permease